jgi:hypothetical protein
MKQANARGPAAPPKDDQRRRRLIQEQLAVLGASWALEACQDMLSSGRKIEGGWPGTVPEARMRVLAALTRELSSRSLSPLSPTEVTEATATAYERAKRDWQLASKSPRARATVGAALRGEDGKT